jgi:hypothetical protein
MENSDKVIARVTSLRDELLGAGAIDVVGVQTSTDAPSVV